MVSHTLVSEVDSQLPVSVSPEGIKFLKSINPKAKIITEDMSMPSISRDIGIKEAYKKSILAGVDYFLISYDKDLAYRIH